ncbi:hypothetical protein AgCh_006584 [Apium graveolens]
MYGGLSPDLNNLDQIKNLPRPTAIPDTSLLCDLLWSDPSNDVKGWGLNDRGVSFTFGPDKMSEFLAKHDLDLVYRVHQVVEDGYEFFAERQLVTIFSAPNYYGEFDNAGAMMSVDGNLMCSFQKPLIMALSNPTSQAECTAEEAYNWSEGRAVFASGSPFDPVKYNDQLFIPGQANNAYIFPGLGLGLVMSGAIRMHDEMLLAASEALACQVTQEHYDKGMTFPPFSNIRTISANIAAKVAAKAYDLGLATRLPRPEDLVKFAKSCMYSPNYRIYRSWKQEFVKDLPEQKNGCGTQEEAAEAYDIAAMVPTILTGLLSHSSKRSLQLLCTTRTLITKGSGVNKKYQMSILPPKAIKDFTNFN